MISSANLTSESGEGEAGEAAPHVQLELTQSAAKDLRAIGNKKHLGQLGRKLGDLRLTPLPQDARPIQGEDYRALGWNFYRVDVGEYRIVYDLNM